MTFDFLPEARADSDECYGYLRDQSRSLGERFLVEVDSAIQEILINPRVYGRAENVRTRLEVRVYPIRALKHYLTYAIVGQRIVFVAVDRHRRRPRMVRERLRQFSPLDDGNT